MSVPTWTNAEAHVLWAAQLRDLASELREFGDPARARELERQAQVHQQSAAGLRRARTARIASPPVARRPHPRVTGDGYAEAASRDRIRRDGWHGEPARRA